MAEHDTLDGLISFALPATTGGLVKTRRPGRFLLSLPIRILRWQLKQLDAGRTPGATGAGPVAPPAADRSAAKKEQGK